MLKQSLLISGAILGSLALGQAVVHADSTTPDTTITQAKKATLTPRISDGSHSFSENDDSQLPSGSSSSDSQQSTGEANQSSHDTPAPTPGDDHDNGSTLPPDQGNGSNSSTTPNQGNGSSSSSTPDQGNGSSTSSTSDQGNSSSTSSTPNQGNSTSTTDQSNQSNSSSTSSTDNQKLPTQGIAPTPVPLTDQTPDVNTQGQLNQVTPVAVAQSKQGEAPVVPHQVATVPSVARAVADYNKTLAQNDQDATKAPVVAAKQAVDEAVNQALPKTHADRHTSLVGGVIALATGFSLLGLLGYNRFKKQ
ncbi:serine-rich aggregation substance UasX [Leuconostoc citreum]|uniref:serine-rich aggregation substance UasX n=1 Tax=Leuconostoc citreum TaxID=33964 RepID=UPI0032E00CB2